MRIFVTVFAFISMKLLYDGYYNNIRGCEQTVLALVCSFFCGMLFGEYLLLRRQRKYFFGEIDFALSKYHEMSKDKCK